MIQFRYSLQSKESLFMAFYQRLRDLREDADLTQRQAAELIGTSMNHYGKYERGETDIPFEKAVILAQFYDVSLDYLAGLTNIKSSFTKTASNSSYLVNLFLHLTSSNQNRIEERMLEMLEQQRKKK
mgnify:CR=1 FL=1